MQLSDKKVSNGKLAEIMKVKKPSVSEMVKKLSETGYIQNKPYHGFSLTIKGEQLALDQIRKHRLIEYFLKYKLKYEWDEVHSEAEIIEHSVSDKFIYKLEKYLKFPKFDPHGAPIPDKNRNLIKINSISLNCAEINKYYFISSVDDKSEESLKFISRTGIKLNSKIKVINKSSIDNSINIIFKRKIFEISKIIAEKIFVSPYQSNSSFKK